jgi:hypothetical protein
MCSENPDSSNRTRQAADRLVIVVADPGGWIPAILPNDATTIREVDKVDESRTWGCFSTRRADEVRALLSGLNAHKAPGPIGNRPSEIFRDFSWWPESMSGNALEAWEFREEGRCPACGATVVRVGIDVRNSTVCFHRET